MLLLFKRKQNEIISILTYFIFNRKTFVLNTITIIIIVFCRQQKKADSVVTTSMVARPVCLCLYCPALCSISLLHGWRVLPVHSLSVSCRMFSGVTIDALHTIIRMKAHEKPGNTPLYYIYDRGQSFAGNFFGMACPGKRAVFPIFLPARPFRTHPGPLP